MHLPVIAVAALGGTICMSAGSSSSGVLPSFNAQQLVDLLPGLGKTVTIHAETIFQLPSPSLTLEHLTQVFYWAKHQVESGADGVVITQGTDTLEESAFWLDLFWPYPQPLIVTGAMRNPDTIGAEGSANLFAAIKTAAAPESRNRGVLVVMNDTIHRARWVRKSHSLSVETFISPNSGPQGMVVEQYPQYLQPASPRHVLTYPETVNNTRIALIESCLSDNGDFIKAAIDKGYDGIVISAFGVGHISSAMMDEVERHLPTLPVIIASRTGSGATVRNTYGFRGAEIDLCAKGAIMAGWLCPRKSRLLLLALLAGKASYDEICQSFAHFDIMNA